MEVFNSLLLWLHLLGLAMGGGALIGTNVLAMVGSATPAEQRPALLPVGGVLTAIGRAAIGLLIVTGPLMLWLKWGGHTPSDAWFGIKMLFVVILIVGIIMSSIGLKRITQGNAAGAALARQGRLIASGALVIVVLAAAFTFG